MNVFIHRRDHRVQDNSALNKLLLSSPNPKVLHIFIFNPDQIDAKRNNYYSKNSVEFLVQSLQELDKDLLGGLNCFYGKDILVLTQLCKQLDVQKIAFNADYTPFARARDEDLMDWCKKMKIECIVDQDYTLFDIGSIRTPAYEVFTPFYNKCISMANIIAKPSSATPAYTIYKNQKLTGLVHVKDLSKFYQHNPNPTIAVKGGRKNALQIIQQRVSTGQFSNYSTLRDMPAQRGTTQLSAYIKYGCVSIREVFFAIKGRYGLKHSLIKELLWREFYANIAYSFPRVLEGQIQKTPYSNKSFKTKYDAVKWKHDPTHWDAFLQGKTGFPFVDAGIRQTLATGWCHNRARMVLAMFASKDIHIHPNIFELWFARRLVDYDPSSNSGGVQWAYGTGSDSQPYFRIFNPFLQSQRYDRDAKYIKEWIPELRDIPAPDIHKWATAHTKYPDTLYPKPILDHATQSKVLINQFRTASG